MLHLRAKWVGTGWFDTGCAAPCPPVVPELEQGTQMLPRCCDSCGSPVMTEPSTALRLHLNALPTPS